jgi:hypothetical protein
MTVESEVCISVEPEARTVMDGVLGDALCDVSVCLSVASFCALLRGFSKFV